MYIGAKGTEFDIVGQPDHWKSVQISQLRDDLETAEVNLEFVNKEVDRLVSLATHWETKHQQLKLNLKQVAAEENADVIRKSLIYLDIVKRYERFIRIHAPHYLETKELLALRKRGGLI